MKNEISVREKPANIVLKRATIANITNYKYRFDNNLKTNKMAVRLFWDLIVIISIVIAIVFGIVISRLSTSIVIVIIISIVIIIIKK